ncbi:SDR family oxidoreductase [Haloparvum alkalitolerans]|uniref:SDR family NAD(P)-dependent oxidoreductase n=1 Tax=Haloparvum alkalitolerans TaxID=1042953 RepID=UPI003CF1F3FA
MTDLSAETVIVTGASRGLGASMARRLTREGANVVLSARDEAALDDVAADVADAPGETLVAPADVTDEAAVEALVDATVDAFGAPTGLVNNAGVGMLSLHDELRDTVTVDADDWRLILEVNLTGAFLCAKHAVPHMVAAGRGNVINVSSGLGRRAAAGWGPYVASKWGLEGFSRTLADEVEADGVNVNCLDPGGRAATGFWDHLPEAERDGVLPPDVMDDAITLLLAQGPDGVTRESLPAEEWEERLDA